MNTKKIAIIGGGNLGTAIAEGLLKSGFAKPAQITITRRTLSRLEDLKAKGVTVTDNNASAIRESGLF
jgi:pyrroline-5-carboxylate reductase